MIFPTDIPVPMCSELSLDDQNVTGNQKHLWSRHGQRHPFGIQEVLLLIGSYLDHSSVARAVRVSRSWYTTLHPLVWENIDLILEAGSYPEVKTLQSKSSLVKHLTVTAVDVVSLGISFTCPNLVELTLIRVKNVNEEYIKFIQRHQSTLTSISTSYYAEGELLEAIIECPRLKTLSSHMGSISSSEWISVFKRLWCRLESLHFRGFGLPSSSEEPESIEQLVAALSSASGSVPTAKIQTLLIDPLYDENPTTIARLLWLLQQCPELRHLQWSAPEESDVEEGPMRWLAQEIQSGHRWDKLSVLVLPQSFYLDDFIVVMEGVVRLKELDLRGTGFNMSTWLALKEKAPRHLSTLTHLCLLECRQLDGPVVHDILCSCPNLEGFEAHKLRDTDMDDRPWVCLGLKSMLLTLKEDPDFEEERVIVSRLSTLVNLEALILYKSRFRLCLTDEDDGGPLNRLQTLGRLKFFSGSIRDDQEVWGANEAEWILTNWPQLQTLHSTVSRVVMNNRGMMFNGPGAPAPFVTHVSTVFGSLWELFLAQGGRSLVVIDSPGLQERPLHPLVNRCHIISLIKLIATSPQLKALNLQSFTFKDDAMEMLGVALRHHPSLKHVEIGNRYTESNHRVQSFLWNTFRLETLSLGFSIFDTAADRLNTENVKAMMAFTEQEDPVLAVKRLCVPEIITEFSRKQIVEILRRCHHVEYLMITSTHAVWGWPKYLVPVAVSNMPHLQHLDFQASDLRGSHLTGLIRACRHLLTLKAYFIVETPDEVVEALIECHSESLMCCQIYSTDHSTSPRILGLLTLCSRLEVLDLMVCPSWWLSQKMFTQHRIFRSRIGRRGEMAVETSDLEKISCPTSAPWVCRDPRVLRIIYTPSPTPPPPASPPPPQSGLDPSSYEILPRVLYERISALSKLEELRLGLPTDYSLHQTLSAEHRWVQNIKEALQAFAKLDRLQKLELRGLGLFVDKAELSRIRKKHWKYIQWVQFSRNQ